MYLQARNFKDGHQNTRKQKPLRQSHPLRFHHLSFKVWPAEPCGFLARTLRKDKYVPGEVSLKSYLCFISVVGDEVGSEVGV